MKIKMQLVIQPTGIYAHPTAKKIVESPDRSHSSPRYSEPRTVRLATIEVMDGTAWPHIAAWLQTDYFGDGLDGTRPVFLTVSAAQARLYERLKDKYEVSVDGTITLPVKWDDENNKLNTNCGWNTEVGWVLKIDEKYHACAGGEYFATSTLAEARKFVEDELEVTE